MKGKAEIVDLRTLSSPLEKSLYHEMVTLLKSADAETKETGKNWGETVSLAYAKVSGITYFLSDEKNLQALADEYLNTDEQHSNVWEGLQGLIDLLHLLRAIELNNHLSTNISQHLIALFSNKNSAKHC